MIEFDEPRSWRRKVRIPTLLIAALAVAGAWIVFNPPSLLKTEEQEPPGSRDVSEIRTASLSETHEAEGVLTFDSIRDVFFPGSGTVTSIRAEVGSVIAGDVLYRIDDVPTIAITGEVPAWRTMAVDAVGDDVLQLEEALVSMGYDAAGLLAVDRTYTSYTAALVELWQADLGVEVTGRINHGAVVFVPLGTRIDSINGAQGDPVPAVGVVTLNGGNQLVEVSIDAAEIRTVRLGDTLVARLPDRSTFDVVVIGVTPASGGSWKVTAAPQDLDPQTLTSGQIPVSLSWEESLGDDLTVVPASALRRLDGGYYALEVIQGSSEETEFVPVQIGEQSGSMVQIISDLSAGSVVVDP